MIPHYLKLAYRHFKGNKLIFFGSTSTLFLGLVCVVLLTSYVHRELTMNNYLKNKDDVFALLVRPRPESKPWGLNPKYSIGFDPAESSDIKAHTFITKLSDDDTKLSVDEIEYNSEGILVSEGFMDIFDLDWLEGKEDNVLNTINSIILTESFAKKSLGHTAMGSLLKVTVKGNEQEFTVQGIVKDMPNNSSFVFDFLIVGDDRHHFHKVQSPEFILLDEGVDKSVFTKKILNFDRYDGDGWGEAQLYLMPWTDIYFQGNQVELCGVFTAYGNKDLVRVILFVILLLLIITALNFSNFQLISVGTTLKNTSILSTLGSSKMNAMHQKLIELIILAFIPIIFNALTFRLWLSFLNRLLNTNLNVSIAQMLLLNVVVTLIIILIGFAYPSFRLNKSLIIRGLNISSLGTKLSGQKVGVVLQFSMLFILLSTSIGVSKQLTLLLHKDIGINTKNIITVKLESSIGRREMGKEKAYNKKKKAQQKARDFIYQELSRNPDLIAYGQGLSPFKSNPMAVKATHVQEFVDVRAMGIHSNLMDVFGLELLEGNLPTDYRACLINESTQKLLKIEDISRDKIRNSLSSEGMSISGVIKDFNCRHLSYSTLPVLIFCSDEVTGDYQILFQEGKRQKVISYLENLYALTGGEGALVYSFIEDEVAAMYKKEKLLKQLYIIATLIAFVMSCIGLFTVSLYDTRRRTKEIGIRKVNGAKIGELIKMLNKGFLLQVSIAYVIAIPLSYLLIQKWLEGFAYKINISWWIFALSALIGWLIAVLSVSWQSWSAARKNPVETLRYE